MTTVVVVSIRPAHMNRRRREGDMNKQRLRSGSGAASLAGVLLTCMLVPGHEGRAQPANTGLASPPIKYLEQGWSPQDRETFYGTSQGSHLIPYAWFQALRRVDVDEPFGGDQLQRYGYLR